jgi:hypothetical protein
MAKFRIALPGLWRPPFTLVDLSTAKINEVPPGVADPSAYGSEDFVVFLNSIQKQIRQLSLDLNKENISAKETADKTYLMSRLQLETTRLIARFGKEFPDFVVTFSLGNQDSYSIVAKAFVSGFRRR